MLICQYINCPFHFLLPRKHKVLLLVPEMLPEMRYFCTCFFLPGTQFLIRRKGMWVEEVL